MNFVADDKMAADPQNEALTADVAAIGVEMSDDDKATREKVVRQSKYEYLFNFLHSQ